MISTRQPKHTFDDIKKMQQLFLDTSDIPEEFEINSTKIWNINYLGSHNHHNYYYHYHVYLFHHFYHNPHIIVIIIILLIMILSSPSASISFIVIIFIMIIIITQFSSTVDPSIASYLRKSLKESNSKVTN